MPSIADLPQRVSRLFKKEIWSADYLHSRSLRGVTYAILRVLSITWTVFNETKAASRAAALSYSSLLGLGPLVAISMLVAGFVLGSREPVAVIDTINHAIKFVAPQVSQYEQSSTTGSQAALTDLLNGFISASRSGTAGALGSLSLIFIVLMLFTSIENAFNEIWGVRRGRSWLLRVVLYWTIVTLGAVLFFASLTALGAGAFVNVFVEKLPFGSSLLTALRWLLPIGSVALLVGILTLFYRFVPNTHVFWRAAFCGAIVVTALVFINNLCAFFYIRRVLQSNSLYGPLSLGVILMLGLYVFWLFVLVGGQVSYAVQNAHFRNSQAAWGQLAENMRERLSLVILLAIGRRFQACQEPCDASQLGDLVRVPTQIVNECLNRLVDMKLVTPVPPAKGAASNDYRYQPARPLSHITLQQFKQLDDNYGDDPTGDALSQIEPLLARYDGELDKATNSGFFLMPLDGLLSADSSAAAKQPSGKQA
jgi:membrane protein